MALVVADFPDITQNQSTYLSDRVAIGTIEAPVLNTSGFNVGDFILYGTIGAEQSEIVQIVTVVDKLNLTTTPPSFSHPIDTTVTYMGYDQVNFYRDNTSGNGSGPYLLLVTLPMAVDYPLGTRYEDMSALSTSFYKVSYYNSSTGIESALSNPYQASVGILDYSLRGIQDRVIVQLNDPNEQRVVRSQLTTWINEGYKKLQRRLRVIDDSYALNTWTPSSPNTDGTFTLPSDFATMFKVVMDGLYIARPIDIRDIDPLQVFITPNPYYYFQANTIGFLPANNNAVVTYYTTGISLVQDTDVIIQPFQDYSDILVNYCVYRFSQIHKPEVTQEYKALFDEEANTMIRELSERNVQFPQGVVITNPSQLMSLPEDII